MAPQPLLLWFRQDLRLSDNEALTAAAHSGRPVLPVFILDDETPGDWAIGGASRWWLHRSLETLSADLKDLGLSLTLRRGKAEEAIATLVEETGAEALYWSRCYEPFAIARDTAVKTWARDAGLEVQSFAGQLLHEPSRIKTGDGDPYKVFTPFWKNLKASLAPGDPLPRLKDIKAAPAIQSDALEDWGLLPAKPNWAEGFDEVWTPGEAGAREKLETFLDEALIGYGEERNRPDKVSTSRLSPHLRWGEISPRQIWAATLHHLDKTGKGDKDAWKFLSELAWREFSYHLLYHWPDFPEVTWRENFRAFPWDENAKGLAAWQKGQTGYPIVDAGMRELWATGYMHNRVRMIAASFLIKDLLVPWQDGEAWFWDTLVDADLANNSASWQWVAGCGADAAPYFRIFNPTGQGEKFDPNGDYVRRWVPELAALPKECIHKPWEAPALVLKEAGVTLGETYPKPIVDHGEARKRALAAFEQIKKNAA